MRIVFLQDTAVNESLAKLQGNGTYDDIYAEWFPGA